MPIEYKVLAQSTPGATTVTDIYTVPADTTAIISSIVVCNRAAVPKTFRISIAPAGAADTIVHYIAYDVTIPANDVVYIQIGITLAATDVIRAYVESADISINVFGLENS
jgi:hypothetical protein